MAFTGESGNLVWQKVKNALSTIQVGAVGATPGSQRAWLDGLKPYLGQQKRNPLLQFVPLDGTAMVTADTVGIAGASTLIGIYLQKSGTVETVFKASNHATVAATDGTQDIAIALTTPAGTDVSLIYPGGRALSTGFTYGAYTTRTGASRVLAANVVNGFAVFSL